MVEGTVLKGQARNLILNENGQQKIEWHRVTGRIKTKLNELAQRKAEPLHGY